jgi:hypothetical protein
MGQRSTRALLWLACYAVLFGLVLAAAGCAPRYASKVRDRGDFQLELKPGQSLSLDSGITLTLPAGILASGMDWGYMHMAREGDGRSEYFIFASPTRDAYHDTTTTIVLVGASWYDEAGRSDSLLINRTHVARSDDVDVYATVSGGRVTLLVLLNVPGYERGLLTVKGNGTDPYAVLESFWRTWRVRPTPVPPKVP